MNGPAGLTKICDGIYRCGQLVLYRFGQSHYGDKWAVVKDWDKPTEKWLRNNCGSLREATAYAKDYSPDRIANRRIGDERNRGKGSPST